MIITLFWTMGCGYDNYVVLGCGYDTCREWVHVLSSEDVLSKVYSLQDVVLPVIGSRTIFPENRVAKR